MRYVSQIRTQYLNVFRWGFQLDDLKMTDFRSPRVSKLMIDIYDTESKTYETVSFDLKSDEEYLDYIQKLEDEGVIGVATGYDSVMFSKYYPKRGGLFNSCLKFVGKTDCVPPEIYSVGYNMGIHNRLDAAYWLCPAWINYKGEHTFFGSEGGTSAVMNMHDYDVFFAKSLIVQYMKDFDYNIDWVSENVKRIADVRRRIVNRDNCPDFDFNGNVYADVKLWRGSRYRLRRDALFQVFGCPLYISGDGMLYLGYTKASSQYDGIIGCLIFKITDVKKFYGLLTKSLILDTVGLDFNMEFGDDAC